MVEIRLHPADGAAAQRDAVAAVWAHVFGPIDDLPHWRETVWERHRAREDSRLITAHHDGELVGFSWGCTGRPGQSWSDLVLDRLGPAAAWVGGHFEFVEFAVLPSVRGRGVGGQLHDALLADLPHERALLDTRDDPTDHAVRLYRGRGWRRLGSQAPGDQRGHEARPDHADADGE